MDQEINNGSLGKKLIVPLVAVALFAILVFGATYAYFTATVDVNTNANISAKIPAKTTGITTSATTCSIEVKASDMVASANNTTEAKEHDDCTLSIKIEGATNVKCTYDLVLKETSAVPYAASSTTYTEYTAEITRTASSGPTTTMYEGTKNDGTAGPVGMNTFNFVNSTEPVVERKAVLKSGTEITVGENNTAVTHTYKLEQKWYNIPAPQDDRQDKTYTFELAAENVVC